MTPLEARRFVAAAERILPARAGLPSVTEANVLGYLEAARENPSFLAFETNLLEGLTLLGDLATTMFDVEFSDAEPEKRDAVLRRLQELPLPAARKFFELLVRLTLAGYLCDPIHGGNRDAIAWRALGVHIERSPSPAEMADA